MLKNYSLNCRTALNLPANLVLHSMRHSWATDAINNGMRIKQVQNQLGHSNPNTTLSIYTGLTEQQKQKTPLQYNEILRKEGFSAPWKL